MPEMSVGQLVKVTGISRNAAGKYRRLLDAEAERERQIAVSAPRGRIKRYRALGCDLWPCGYALRGPFL